MDSAPEVTQPCPDDYAQIKEIINLSFPRFYRYFALHNLTSEEGKVLVAKTQNELAGFAKLIEFNIGTLKYGCILWIAVHPSIRCKGIALNLSNAGVNCLKKDDCHAVFASTQRRNRGALATLTKVGFRRVGFFGLRRIFGWRLFSFYCNIWYAPGEVVLIHDF